MFTNYFKIAFRNLIRNPVYSIINVGGLAVGLASAILIFLWVADEYSYDTFHANYKNIYKLYQQQEWNMGHIGTSNSMPYPLKEVLPAKASQVKYVCITNWGEGNTLLANQKRLNKFGLNVSSEFLKMFSFNLTRGDQNHALDDPSSIVITESTAKAFFGAADPMGQLIQIDNEHEQKVTGVLPDVPRQSEFRFDYLLPFSFYEATQPWVQRSKNSWDNNSFQMFALLQEGAAAEDVNHSIEKIIRDNNPKAPTAKLFLHPMSKWRLFGNFEEGKNTGGLIDYVRLFNTIALFVLVIACINFMNLATARSESRAREVGIRKSVGSSRQELIAQFLGESIGITLMAFILAAVVVELVLPGYNVLVDKHISVNYTNPWLWLGALSLILTIGIFSGSYPSFYLSSFEAVKVLKGKVKVGKGASTPRKILVTLQFGFSIFLIIGTIVIYQQIEHVKNRDIGYDRENLIQVWTNGELETNFQTIRNELVRTGAVKSICKSNSPVTSIFSNNEVKWQGMPSGTRVAFSTIATEYDYTETLGVKMILGRDFSRQYRSDTMAVVINEAAMKMMGFENPIGKKLEWGNAPYEIIGVMKNMVMAQATGSVQPLCMFLIPGWSSTITIRLNKTNDLPGAIAKVETVFKKLNPNYPFEYQFTDEIFNKKFANIRLINRVAAIFAVLAIAITCLGLLGLASFTAEQRTKEMGIRKVLGASVSSLVLLLSKDFTRLVLFAFIISAPVAWWFLNNFLQRYEYRIDIAWWVMAAVGLFALLLALVIVSMQALKAAIVNPVDSLKSE
ncbi:MAG: ABC transporter permease [Bacteroidetes bacterium]|nr:ABC transporter permease [Bacteroidota bacterium]